MCCFKMASNLRPCSYNQYDKSCLEKAISELEKGTIPSVRRAALLYGIPRSTLHDHFKEKVAPNAKPGPAPYLSIEEEEELSNFLVKCSRIGYPKTRQQVLGIVQEIVGKRRPDVCVTNGWWERFSNRHPNICLKTSIPLSYVRAMAEDEGSLKGYFDLLETTLHENDIFDHPSHIYNCDETGMPLNPKPLKVVSERGAKNPSNICGSTKNQVSVLACSSATGHTLPPYIILARKTLNQEITFNEVPGSRYGLSTRGWMDMRLFSEWFTVHFLPYAPSARPLLLLMDGHKSHFCPEMIKMAAKEGIVLFALPPHTTHLCQPLDKGPFAPLKIEWRKVVHKFISANKGREVTVYDFNTVFSEAWYNAMTASNVISGFRCTGIYPFNRNAVKARSEKFRRFDQDALSKGSKINYVPLFSPDRARHTDSNLDTEDENDSSSSASSPPFGNSRCNTLSPIQHKTLKDFLVTPKAPNRGKGPVPKGRVLTSRQNLLLLEEQKKKKQEEAQLKEDRKNLREEKLRLKKLKVSAATRKASKSARSRIATKTSVTTVDDFSPEEEARYERRREEGYDIPDPRYERWLEMTVDPNNLETRKGHCNDSNSSGDNEPFQTKAVYGAASKGSRSEENSLSTSPVIPKPTQTGGRGRVTSKGSRPEENGLSTSPVVPKPTQTGGRGRAASKGSLPEENGLSTSPVVPKPTQTGGRGRAASKGSLPEENGLSTSPVVPKPTQTGGRGRVTSKGSRPEENGLSTFPVVPKPTQTGRRDRAASKGSRSKENSLSTSPVIPKPTQTGGRGRAASKGSRSGENGLSTSPVVPKPTQTGRRDRAASKGSRPEEYGLSTSPVVPKPTQARGRGRGSNEAILVMCCTDGTCNHPRASNWVSCDSCDEWFHCVCAGVRINDAPNTEFICHCCHGI
ncbi:uncharacterized protein LOC135351543 isoform X3 [Halichondria panicea]|uniref:uncharacterized protein LOC135351543 isoform X3 n=1 Tax=Halichondria panicea TaxID=6063 RepID=UPI00312BCBBA